MAELFKSVDDIGEGAKQAQATGAKVRRKSKELTEQLDELHSEVTSLCEAASVWKALGGFKRNRRNSKDLSEDTLRAAFNSIDKDGSGKIDRDELKGALEADGGQLKEEQITAMLNFADTDGDGEIDFEEYKTIMQVQSGVPQKATEQAPAAAPAAATGEKA